MRNVELVDVLEYISKEIKNRTLEVKKLKDKKLVVSLYDMGLSDGIIDSLRDVRNFILSRREIVKKLPPLDMSVALGCEQGFGIDKTK